MLYGMVLINTIKYKNHYKNRENLEMIIMKSCGTCKDGIEVGGDIVPYGNITAHLPTNYECDCINIPEDIYSDHEKMSELANSGNCKYWRKK